MDVSFPGLWGLHFEIRRWAFEIFGLKIYWYGIIIALAFLAAVLLAVRSSRKFNLDPDNILDLVLFAAPAAIVGARLYYVIFSWDQFKDNLLEVFNTRNGGLAIYGGVIGALLVAWIYSRKKKLSFLHIADFAMPYIALGQGIGRWGNFVNQEAHGVATSLPWRMNGAVPDEYLAGLGQNLDPAKWGVHPTFLYESLLDIAIFAFLVLYRKKKRVKGEILMLYLALYGMGRFLIEGLRTDSLMLGNLRVSQMLSLLLVIFGVSMIVYLRLNNKHEADVQPAELGQSEYGSLLQKIQKEEQEEKDQAEKDQAEKDQVSMEATGVAAPVESESGADEIENEKPAE